MGSLLILFLQSGHGIPKCSSNCLCSLCTALITYTMTTILRSLIVCVASVFLLSVLCLHQGTVYKMQDYTLLNFRLVVVDVA